MSTKHQQLNSLVQQVHEDAKGIANTAGMKPWFSPDEIKIMRDRANSILAKLVTYEALSE